MRYTLKGPTINVNIFMNIQNIHFLKKPSRPQKKEYTSTFLSVRNPMKIIKSRPKVYGKKC